MASLYWFSRVLRTSSFDKSIASHRGSLHGTLIMHGYENMRINDMEIAGGKEGCWISIGHFFISQVPPHIGSSGQYWEIVMCACDGNDLNKARTIAVEVATLSKRINP